MHQSVHWNEPHHETWHATWTYFVSLLTLEGADMLFKKLDISFDQPCKGEAELKVVNERMQLAEIILHSFTCMVHSKKQWE